MVAFAALAVLALLFALHVYRWHLPHRSLGALGEWPLIAAASAVGAVGYYAWRGRASRRDSALPVAALAALAAFLALQAADPFVAHRDWLYAPADCDFTVSFPRRAEVARSHTTADGAAVGRPVERAVLVNIGSGTALNAECAIFDGAGGDLAARLPALRANSDALLRAAAQRLRVKVAEIAQPAANVVVLRGVADEGRTADNEPLLRKAEARAVIGDRSILVLWAWRITRDPAAEIGVDAMNFFGAVRRHARGRP